MILKNLKTALRNIINDKFYSLINITGLASGIAIAIFILMFVNDEFSYDKHVTNHNRIHRLESDLLLSGNQDKFALTPLPLAITMKEEFPEIKEIVRFLGAGVEDILFKYEDKEFYEDSMYFVDSTLFDVFDYKLVSGSVENALNRPLTMVISASMANRYFGDEHPIGKTIKTSNFGDYEVSAVIEDLPGNTHMKFNCLLSVSSLVELLGAARFNDRSAPSFWGMTAYSFILLNENTNISLVHEKFPEFYTKYMEDFGTRINGSYTLLSTPLNKTHFNEKSLQWDLPVGDRNNTLIFSFVAIFIILIACINYMNMATARSANRAREVGVKKVVGAHRGSLIRQFLGESTLVTFISLIFSFLLVLLLLPTFNQLADKNLLFLNIFSPLIISGTIIIAIVIAFVSGSYPAFFLSSFVPQKVLKGSTGSSRGKGLLRKVLVVFQFSISLIMIIGTLVVTKQQKFIKNSDLGFNKENILIVPARDTSFIRNIPAFREEILAHADIEYVATANLTPTSTNQSKTVFNIDIDGEMTDKTLSMNIVDFDYIQLMDMQILAGRDFDRTISTDTTRGFIINEALVKSIGWSNEDAIGKRIRTGLSPDGTFQRDGEIIGVVNDFHFGSLHNAIDPFVFLLINTPIPNIHIKFNGDNHSSAIDFIKKIRSENFNVNTPLNYYYLDDRIDDQYSSDKKLGLLFTIFAILTIFISCLGLLGLSAFVTRQRTREIGIRKVLGSSNSQIITLISRSFIYLVGIAILIAILPSYYIMSKWMQDFAYQAGVGIMPFVIGAVLAIVITIITVSLHAFKASNANPAESLKYE